MGQIEINTEKRVRKELTEQDRYMLERCLSRGDRIAEIGKFLKVHPRTIRGSVLKFRTYC